MLVFIRLKSITFYFGFVQKNHFENFATKGME
jgi:hypothetical protein